MAGLIQQLVVQVGRDASITIAILTPESDIVLSTLGQLARPFWLPDSASFNVVIFSEIAKLFSDWEHSDHLPAEAIMQQTHMKNAARLLQEKLLRLRILIVEDDPSAAEPMKRRLEEDGYSVRCVASYKEALHTTSQWLPDLLISDIGLPGKDGLEVMKMMRRAYPTLKGLVVSGYTSPEDVECSRQAGFSQHFAKPVNLDKLSAAVCHLIA